jgi:inosine-uridine nucleoside N-ribohydrolase
LKKKLFTAKEVHGSDGIGNASRLYNPPKFKAVPHPAVDVILELLRREPNTTLVATGPLTNIASAITKDFAVMKRTREIVVMGGAFQGVHNTGPVAEFNFYADPDAADCVMQSGLPVRLIPLNVTEHCVLTLDDLRTIADPSLRRYLQRITKFYFDFHKRTANVTGGYLHDPLAVASVAFPSLLKTHRGYVRVEWAGTYARGLSIFFPLLNIHNNAELPGWVIRALRRKPSVRVATTVNANSFKQKFLGTLRRAR